MGDSVSWWWLWQLIGGYPLSEREPVAGHVFISYVRQDAHHVDRLQRDLEAAGIRVWRDTADLWPGQDWQVNIRRAITDSALVFLACFSRQSVGRRQSYQNEELTLAIEQLRKRPHDDVWLIPVRFDACRIPDRDIGGGRTFASIQRADLFGDGRGKASERLVEVIRRVLDGAGLPGNDAGLVGISRNDFSLSINVQHGVSDRLGEDADPLVYWPPGPDRSISLVAVFDGVGGAGTQMLETSAGPRTGAWIASRAAREALVGCALLLNSPRAGGGGEAGSNASSGSPAVSAAEMAERVTAAITQGLVRQAAAAHAGPGPYRGTNGQQYKRLPTTMAAAWFDLSRGTVTSLWAGDSRTYLLTREDGLQQISSDDVESGADALQVLSDAFPLSNFLSAERDFVIWRRTIRLSSPFALFAATDGCFSYLPSPQHFEHLLLASLRESDSVAEWQRNMGRRVAQVTGDDSTLAGVVVGWDDIAEMHQDFQSRYRYCASQVRDIDERYEAVRRLDDEAGVARQHLARLKQELWDQYRPKYYALRNSAPAEKTQARSALL